VFFGITIVPFVLGHHLDLRRGLAAGGDARSFLVWSYHCCPRHGLLFLIGRSQSASPVPAVVSILSWPRVSGLTLALPSSAQFYRKYCDSELDSILMYILNQVRLSSADESPFLPRVSAVVSTAAASASADPLPALQTRSASGRLCKTTSTALTLAFHLFFALLPTQLKDTHSVDLLILKEIIACMAAIESTEDMNDAQIEGQRSVFAPSLCLPLRSLATLRRCVVVVVVVLCRV
jgi:hypothetical protein